MSSKDFYTPPLPCPVALRGVAIGETPKKQQFLRRGVRKVVRLYCLTPPSLRATSPIWLRHTEEEFKVTLYSFAMSRGRGYFTPLLYMANTVLRNAMGHSEKKGIYPV